MKISYGKLNCFSAGLLTALTMYQVSQGNTVLVILDLIGAVILGFMGALSND